MQYVGQTCRALQKRFGEHLWRLIHAKNPDLQTMYTSVVNVYFFLNTAM